MSALPADKQLLTCGHNEAGNLSFLPHCRRWYINGENPCKHNAWTSDGRSYCSRMVLRPTHVLWTNNIRVIGSCPKSSFLDINGCWQVLPPYLAIRARFDYPAGKDIKQLFEFDDRTKLGFYTENGCFWILDLQKFGPKGLSVHFPTWRRQILHLCFGGCEPAILIVHKAEPHVVTQLTSFSDCLAWLVESQQPGGVMAYSLAMRAPIAQIVGNLSAFTVRLEGGKVYTWDVEAFALAPEGTTIFEPVHAPAPDPQEIKIHIDSTPKLTPEESPTPNFKAEDALQAQGPQGLHPKIETENEPDPPSPSNSEIHPPIKPEPQSTPPLKPKPLSSEEDTSDTSLYSEPHNPPSPPPDPTPIVRRLLLPPSTRLLAARFITGSLSPAGLHLWRDPTADDPHLPHLNDIGTSAAPVLQYVGEGLRLVDASISAHHIVAVAEGGEVFSKGRGWHGELGVGEKVFDLRAGKGDGDEGKEFAEGWLRMDVRDVRPGMRIRRVYTGEGTTFLVAEKMGAEGVTGVEGRNA
jgi:hypothetical protein